MHLRVPFRRVEVMYTAQLSMEDIDTHRSGLKPVHQQQARANESRGNGLRDGEGYG